MTGCAAPGRSDLPPCIRSRLPRQLHPGAFGAIVPCPDSTPTRDPPSAAAGRVRNDTEGESSASANSRRECRHSGEHTGSRNRIRRYRPTATHSTIVSLRATNPTENAQLPPPRDRCPTALHSRMNTSRRPDNARPVIPSTRPEGGENPFDTDRLEGRSYSTRRCCDEARSPVHRVRPYRRSPQAPGPSENP